MTGQSEQQDRQAAKGAGGKAGFGGATIIGGALAAGAGVLAVVLGLGLLGVGNSGPQDGSGSVRLGPVNPADLEAALQTISPEQQSQTREDVANCKTALFMMEVGPMPGAAAPPSGYVQVRVGTYVSPRFSVGPRATVFAVPHPIPEATTIIKGAVIVTGTARGARVQFSPPVDFPVLSGAVTQQVKFDPPAGCGTDKAKPAG
ncbi:hypothetical protein EGN72_01985 [Pseudorhodobacter sp. E13]|uniref:hypothetical protein n=1 Tax=Pseudorhodobacter sp. E13 TaxID=2487931 RepID=UPI000F8DAA5D|nr:hypothetical protein [Pseudorhodobacter sp. E13]RUS65011.1 hypothetical protein EGN72_01985 [Pseudorhodobacter sp. E13]